MTTNTRRDILITLVIACFAGFLFVPFIGVAHLFEGEELRNAEIAREMLLMGDYFRTHLDFQASWEKPPLFFWLQTASMRLFGINEVAARLPNIFLGILVLPMLFLLGKRLYSRSFGVLWVMCYGCSLLPILLGVSALPEALANTLLIFTITFIASYYVPTKGELYSMRRIAVAGILLGAAILTQGFAAMLLVGTIWLLFWFVRRREVLFPITELSVLLAIALGVSFVWFGGEFFHRGLPFFRQFAVYHVRLLTSLENYASTPFTYHLARLFIGCFPASALILPAFAKHPSDTPAFHTFKTWMILLLVTLLLVCMVTQPPMPHYISLAAFSLSFLAAHTLTGLLSRKQVMTGVTKVLCVALSVLWTLVLVAVPILGMNAAWLLTFTVDVFLQTALQANISWSAWEVCIGALFGVLAGLSIFFMLKKRYFEWMITLFPASALTFVVFVSVVAPKLEGYSQRAAIEFYQGLQGKECYIATLDFTSFGSLFYAQKQYSQSASALNLPPEEFAQWLLEGELDKPAFFVCKVNTAATWRKHPHLTELYAKNGFVFFKRAPKPAPYQDLTLFEKKK